MKDTFGAQNPRSWLLRFHTQTAGCSLTAQQPENNIIRTAWQALAAVLGGTQSLHTNSMDEALALPSAYAVKVALRTQQLIAHESGVTNTVDPLAGSYFIEAMTNRLEQEAYDYFHRIEAVGGVIPAIEKGFFQREIAEAAYRYQMEIDSRQRVVVGINEHTEDEPIRIPLLEMDPEGYERQVARLERVRRERDNEEVSTALEALREVARGTENTMPFILDCVRAYATLGEIMGVFRQAFGEYREPTII
jgi:methylmalonyl-CoA mutase N-terminal domain/subunit